MIMGGAVAVAVLIPSVSRSPAAAHLPGVPAQHRQALGDAADQPHGVAHGGPLPPGRGGHRMNTPAIGGSVAALERGALAGVPRKPAALPIAGACYLVLIGLAIRKVEPWVTVVLSATVISFGSELTCYYYAFLIIPALLYAVVPRAGEWLLWLTALTQFLGWAPINHMPHWLQVLMPASLRQSSFVTNFSMPNGLDEQYTWMSVGTLVVFVLNRSGVDAGTPDAMAPALADGHPGEGARGLRQLRPLPRSWRDRSRPQQVDSRARTRKRKRR